MSLPRSCRRARALCAALAVASITVGCSDSHGTDGGSLDGGGSDGGSTADGGPMPDASVADSMPPARDFTSCDVPSVCVLASNTCCGTCGPPSLDDVDPIRGDLSGAYYMEVICPEYMTVGCPDCPSQANPNLIATCAAATCAEIDIGTHPVSACATNEDCVVRTPRCCECGAPTAVFDLVAINGSMLTAFESLVCDPSMDCATCVPDPPTVNAYCGTDDHCHVFTGIGP